VSLECHDWPAIRCTLTPCYQPNGNVDRRNATVSVKHDGPHGRAPYRPSPATTTFPETMGKAIPNFHQHSTKECFPATPRKSMRMPRYNYAQRLRKFAGCMQSKRNLSVDWISNNNQQSLRSSNGDVEPLCVVEKAQRQSNSHCHVNQYDRTHDATPASADSGTSIASAHVYAGRARPVMSTCSLAQKWHVECCVQQVRRRTKRLSHLHLANATLNFRRSSRDIAEDFARIFQLNSDEKYQTQRELAKMRLAQKALCLKLRSDFPVSCQSEHSRQAFLEHYDSTTQRVCSHHSDSDDCAE